MSKRILLTGITGFLGSHLAKELVKNGYKVIALKRKSSSLARIKSIIRNVILYDIDELDFEMLFKKHGEIDAVIHTATSYGRNGESIGQIFEANTIFPMRLLEVASKAGVGLFINTDTILDKYLNIYSLSKNQFLQWGRFFSMLNRIHFSNLRLEHIYGPGDDDSKFTTFVIKSCIENVPTLELTLGEQKRDFIYIDDAISVYMLLVEKLEQLSERYVEFDVGSGSSIPIRDFVENVHRLTQSDTKLMFGALPYRYGEVMESHAKVESLRKLGWTCKTTLEQGLMKVIEECRQ
jgi:nucleoside-diphosphate-sugar epimerase